MASKKDNKRLTAKTLIDKGKKQGSLTLWEIMEAFSETELDKDQVENLYETLGNLGIEIIEDKTQKADVDFSDNDNDLMVDDHFDGVSDDELKKEDDIEMDKIDVVKQDDKNIMRVKVVYKDKEKSYPYIVVETNLNELPDSIELNTSVEDN